MMLQMLPMLAFADGTTGTGETYVAWNENQGNKGYTTLEAAVAEAKSGETIILGEGNYTLYGIKSDDTTKGKNLTFVGQGPDKTAWNIGDKVPDPSKYGTEYNGDYSFDGAGTVTFKNMTLRSGVVDYLGFIRIDVLNFLKILCEKGTLRELPGCARAYRVRYNQAHGILEAAATTAVAMTEQQVKSLHEKLEKLTGKTIDLKTKVDPAVLGGIRLDIEGTELDGTVQNRLAALRRDIASVTL